MPILLLVLLLMLPGCGGDEGDLAAPQQQAQSPQAAAITLVADKKTVLVGELVTLTAAVTPPQSPPPGLFECWHISRPQGSFANIGGADDRYVSAFTPDIAGVYSVRFGWCDGQPNLLNWPLFATAFVTATAPPPSTPPPADTPPSSPPPPPSTPPPPPPPQEPPPPPPPQEPPPPPVIQHVTLIFDGELPVGTAHGDWTYRLDAPLLVTNQGGLINRVYALERWDVSVTSNTALMPSQTFSNGDGSTAELCIGICKFGGEGSTILRLRKDVWLLEIAFALVNPQQLTPPLFTEIGGFRSSLYRNEPEHVPLTFFLSGSVSTPEAQQP